MTASRLNFYLRVHPSSFIKSQLGNVIENIILQLLPIPILLLVSTMPTRCLSFSASFFFFLLFTKKNLTYLDFLHPDHHHQDPPLAKSPESSLDSRSRVYSNHIAFSQWIFLFSFTFFFLFLLLLSFTTIHLKNQFDCNVV